MSQLQDLNHKHILVSASGLQKAPQTAEQLDEWLRRLVEKVDMRILMGPYSIRCDTLGNEGVTGVCAIETSHCSVHIWSECPEPFLRADLYSCKDFNPLDVFELIKEFDPCETNWIVVNRNGRQSIVTERETFFR